MRGWDCVRVRARFGDASVGRLRPKARRAWEEHLASCSRCRGEWEAFQALLRALEGLSAPAPPASLRQRTMAALRAQQGERVRPRLSPRWAWAVAGLLAAGLLWSLRSSSVPPWERASPPLWVSQAPIPMEPHTFLARQAQIAGQFLWLDPAPWVVQSHGWEEER